MPERSTSTDTPSSHGSPDGRLVVGAGGAVGFLDAAGLDGPGLDAAIAEAVDLLPQGALLTVSAPWSAEPEVVALAARHGAGVVAALRHADTPAATFALVLGPLPGAHRGRTTE